MAKNPIKYFVVDAFTDTALKGNPAAVCLLENALKDEDWMQALASELNMSTTGFLSRIPESELQSGAFPRFRIRWFTPVSEVKLCGHVTLATSHVLFTYGLVNSDKIEFLTASGVLTAKRIPKTRASNSNGHQNGDFQEDCSIELDFPVVPIAEFNSGEISEVAKSLNASSVVEIKKTAAEDLLVVLPSGEEVLKLEPNIDEVKRCPGRGIIVTGPAPPDSGFDFYSRFFCPKYGVNEDPVCGSANCALTPYWSKKLGKCDFLAYQASRRSGVIDLHLDEKNQRVLLRGKAVVVAEGSILV